MAKFRAISRFIFPLVTAVLIAGCSSPFYKPNTLDEAKCRNVITTGVPVVYQSDPKELLSAQHEAKKDCFSTEFYSKRLDTTNNQVFDTYYKVGYEIKTESRVSDIGVVSNKDGQATFLAVVNNFSDGYSVSFPVEITVDSNYKISNIVEYNKVH